VLKRRENIKARLQITCKHDTITKTPTYSSNFSKRYFTVYVSTWIASV